MKTMTTIKTTCLLAAFIFGCSADTFVSGDGGDPGDGATKDSLVVGTDANADAGEGGQAAESGSDAGVEAETGPAFKRVFISSTKVTSNFGSLAAADAVCATAATGAGLSGTWKAWVSTSSTSAASRLSHSGVPYQLVDGTVVASNWSSLVSGAPLKNSIYLDEHGTYVPDNYPTDGITWTGTASDGSSSAASCSDWTVSEDCSISTSHTGTVGTDGNVDAYWTAWNTPACCTVQSFAFFCFEQ